MRHHALLRWVTLWFAALASAWGAQDVRFSNTLNAEERAASGLTRLTSDEVAVIDALVRRDTTSRMGSINADTAARFSGRLTAGERQAAGFQKLKNEELPQLDGLIDRFQNAKLARSLLSPPTYLARASRVVPTEAKKGREIHGSFSLSYGMGSGGYSEKTGSMVLTMDDPERRYSISIGYSESHIKGGHVYRDPLYYGRDPFYGTDPFYNRDPYYGRDPFYDHRDPFYAPGRLIPSGPLPRD
jgi:hypothetical protein